MRSTDPSDPRTTDLSLQSRPTNQEPTGTRSGPGRNYRSGPGTRDHCYGPVGTRIRTRDQEPGSPGGPGTRGHIMALLMNIKDQGSRVCRCILVLCRCFLYSPKRPKRPKQPKQNQMKVNCCLSLALSIGQCQSRVTVSGSGSGQGRLPPSPSPKHQVASLPCRFDVNETSGSWSFPKHQNSSRFIRILVLPETSEL